MPDEQTAQAPAPESVETTATPPVSDGASTQEGAEPTSEAPDPYAAIAELDVDELIRRDPRLQGKIGSAAQRQAKQMADEAYARWQADQGARQQAEREKQRREEKRRLAQTDPDKLAEITLEETTQDEAREWNQRQWNRMTGEMAGHIRDQLDSVYSDPDIRQLYEQGDDDTRARLDWRNYPSYGAFTKAVAKVYADSVAGTRADELARKRLDAELKSRDVERMQGEASEGVDLGLGGLVPGGRVFSREDIGKMSLDEWRRHKDIIAAQERAGLIK